MSNTSENLGRPVAWQIRDIPESIRDAVVEQARQEKVNVAELVTRLVLDARAAGWSFSAANGFANSSNVPDPARVRAASELLGNMGRAGVPVQKGVAALFNRLRSEEHTSELQSRRDLVCRLLLEKKKKKKKRSE